MHDCTYNGKIQVLKNIIFFKPKLTVSKLWVKNSVSASEHVGNRNKCFGLLSPFDQAKASISLGCE